MCGLLAAPAHPLPAPCHPLPSFRWTRPSPHPPFTRVALCLDRRRLAWGRPAAFLGTTATAGNSQTRSSKQPATDEPTATTWCRRLQLPRVDSLALRRRPSKHGRKWERTRRRASQLAKHARPETSASKKNKGGNREKQSRGPTHGVRAVSSIGALPSAIVARRARVVTGRLCKLGVGICRGRRQGRRQVATRLEGQLRRPSHDAAGCCCRANRRRGVEG